MDRKAEILQLLERGYSNAKELATYFDVSLMTVYRDLRELEEEGKIVRRYGRIELNKKNELQEDEEKCAFCGKDVDNRFGFTYWLRGRNKLSTCCPHCGLLIYDTIDEREIEVLLTKDFITCSPINAYEAWYVLGCDISPCCRPSAFAFGDKKHANSFAKGFEGFVFGFDEAKEKIKELMKRGQRVNVEL